MSYELFSDFELLLSERLRNPLPGYTAHARMASRNYRQPVETGLPVRQGAVLILFFPAPAEIGFPLILRPQYNGVHSGQMAFPGGRVEPEDENLIMTALRETREEIGVRPEDVKVAGLLSELYVAASNTKVQPVVGTIPFRPEYIPDAREVAQVCEIWLSEIRDEKVRKEGRMPVRGGYVSAPYYDIAGQKIWGATAMMISELLEIIEP